MRAHVLLIVSAVAPFASCAHFPSSTCEAARRQRQPTIGQTKTGATAALDGIVRIRGGDSTSFSFAPPFLRVLLRMIFPGNPPRTRAPPPPPAPPPAPPSAASTSASGPGLNRGGKGKGRRGGGSAKPGSVHHVQNKADFDKIIKSARSKQLVVVDFAASWCGPCQQIAPKFEAMAAAMPHVKFLKVDVDECKDLSQQYGVQSMPTFKFLKAGKEVDEMKGADEGALREKIESMAGAADRWASAGSGRQL
mmetsp:Transcript_33196/g.87243  ORF Transcript_33196/g.87243 Transcript_33196/m.87243 type:complete len:250 (+) Transcript_33196:1-750(+)